MFSDIHMQHKMQYLFVVVDIIMNALKEKFHGASLSLNAGNTFYLSCRPVGLKFY